MFFKILGYYVASILLLQRVDGQAIDTRIVGGTTTSISSSPYLMKIRLDERFICGGSLGAPQYVITAAHCCQGVAAARLLVIGGATKLSELGVKRKVVNIMIHPNFKLSTMNNDVAVLKLDGPMAGPNIRRIDLYTGALNPGMIVKVSGWGFRSENAKKPSSLLRTIKVPIIAEPKCQNQYHGRITKTMFCASKPGLEDACSGDSGSPAVCNGKLCGIVSWGNGCARRKFPGVYTNVKVVINFIRNCMQK